MEEVNVRGTENVLDAARDAGIGRTVYVSTVNAFGDTGRQVVDESSERVSGHFVSEYDRTKWQAHYRVAEPLVTYGGGVMVNS